MNRYDQQRLTGFADLYNPLGGANITTNLSWTDVNGDDLAQGELGCLYLSPGCEINFAQRPANFGVRSLNTPDPEIKRPYTIETSVGIQHELFPRVSVAGTFLRTSLQNAIYSRNTLLTAGDYTPVSVVSPLDGSVFTAYNLNRDKLGQVANLDTNDPDGGQLYDSIEFNLNVRLPPASRCSAGRQRNAPGCSPVHLAIRTTPTPCSLRPAQLRHPEAHANQAEWHVCAPVVWRPGGGLLRQLAACVLTDSGRRRTIGRDQLADFSHYGLRRQLPRPVHAGRAGRPKHDGLISFRAVDFG